MAIIFWIFFLLGCIGFYPAVDNRFAWGAWLVCLAILGIKVLPLQV